MIFVAEDGESGPGGCVGKTPVSLLQELYVRRGMVPLVMKKLSLFIFISFCTVVTVYSVPKISNTVGFQYDLVQIEGAVHEPTFKYRNVESVAYKVKFCVRQ